MCRETTWLVKGKEFGARYCSSAHYNFGAGLRIHRAMGHSANPTDLVRKSAALTLLLAFLAFATHLAGTQSSARAPKFPRLELDAVSGVIRDQIQKAYDYARAHPNEAQASGALGMILQTYGLAQEAKMYYQYAAELQPTEFRWTYYLGVLEADQGHCDQARSHLQLALRIDPDYVPAALHLANCLFASAEWEASQKLYSQVLKQDADNPDAHYGLGRIQSNQRDYKAAVESFRKALASFPNYGAAHYALALAYGGLGETEKTEEQLHLFEQHKTDAPPADDPLMSDVRALNRSAIFQVQMGIDLERQGKLEQSAAAHEKALAIDGNLAQAHINLIRLYGEMGQFDKAEQHYLAAIQLDPGSAEAFYNHGVLLLSTGKYERAEDAFRKAIDINPYYADAHNNLGYLLERRSFFSEAAAEYQKAIDNKPSDRQAHFNLGRILVNQKRYQEGISELEKTIEPEDEKSPRYLYALGAAFARSGDRQSALRYIRRAREEAVARGQSDLLASIDRDLHALESPSPTQ
jgi:tetratricopeptide (TPR) repeat protein